MERKPKWLAFIEKRMLIVGMEHHGKPNRNQLRKELGISSPSTVNNWWLKSLKNPPSKHLSRMAIVLMCTELEIINGKGMEDQFNKEDLHFLRLVKQLDVKTRSLALNNVKMFYVEHELLSKKSQNILKAHDHWIVTIDKKDKKHIEPVFNKKDLPSKKPDMRVDIYLQT